MNIYIYDNYAYHVDCHFPDIFSFTAGIRTVQNELVKNTYDTNLRDQAKKYFPFQI